jgi:hypothetical protein
MFRTKATVKGTSKSGLLVNFDSSSWLFGPAPTFNGRLTSPDWFSEYAVIGAVSTQEYLFSEPDYFGWKLFKTDRAQTLSFGNDSVLS